MLKKILFFITIILLFGAFFYWRGETFLSEKRELPLSSSSDSTLSFIIDYGDGRLLTFQEGCDASTTAFDILSRVASTNSIPLETKKYEIGTLVERIGDKKNGDGSKYWLYYVNGKAPMVAADKMEVRPGDEVKFSFEKSPF